MNNNFYPKKNDLNSKEIIQIVDKYFINQRNTDFFHIFNVSSLEIIRDNSVLFLDKEDFEVSTANCHVITEKKKIFENEKFKNITLVNNLSESFNSIVNHIFFHEDSIDFKDNYVKVKNSYISLYATIDPSTIIYNNCVIGRGVQIGKNCIIKNNVVIKNSIIGNDVIISDNTTIGSTGFGFNLNKFGSKNLNPQIGLVVINDGVYIGSNCSIDRGKIDNTVIGQNSMLDNQIHIAHNVQLGQNACIAAQTGISGSTIIGNNIIIGGQSGFAGHLKIGDNVTVAAKSGVTKNLKSNSIVAGFPAIDIKEWKKNIIKIKKYGY